MVDGQFLVGAAKRDHRVMSDPASSSDAPVRVLIVDSDERTRESLVGLLAIGDRVTVVGEAGQPARALELALETSPDLVVIDPRLPELDGGLAFIGTLRATVPGVRVLAMSWSDALEAAAIEGGADAFVRKTFRSSELVAAVRACCEPDDDTPRSSDGAW